MEVECSFVGRRSELLKLRKAWDSYKIFGIYGVRSIGKTRLIKQFLFYVKHFQQISEIWIDLKKISSIRRLYISLFAKLKIIFVEREDSIWLYKICSQFVKLESINFVIIFDNAEDILDTKLRDIFLFICNSILSNCTNVKIFIVSTTSMNMDIHFSSAAQIEVNPMSQTESMELLQTSAPSVNFGGCLDTIARLCEGFPLALLMCASELDKNPVLEPDDMVELLIKSRLHVLSPEFYPSTDKLASVYVEFLRRLSPLFQQRMAILATIPGTFATRHVHKMLELPSEENTLLEVLKPTTERHMIEYDSGTKRYGLHGIIKECVSIYLILKDTPEGTELRGRFCKAFVEDYLEISRQFGTKEYMQALCSFNVEQQNFQKLFNDVIYSTEDTYTMYIQIAMSSSGVIQTFIGRQSLRFYKECITMAQKYNHQLDEACVKVAYGCALTDLKSELKTAEQNYRSAIKQFDLSHQTLSTRHLYQLASAYQRLGFNRSEQGKYQDALQILGKSFKLLTDIKVSYDDRILLNTLTVMGLSHMYMCTGSIIVNTLRSFGLFNSTRGRSLFRILNSIGLCNSNIGHLKEAKELLLEVLDRRLRSCGDDAHKHPLVGYCYNNLGVLYRKMGNYKESIKYYELGLHVKITTNAPDHSIALSQNNIAVSLSEFGNHDKALEILDEAFHRLDRFHGLYPNTRSTLLSTKGQILLRKGHYESALRALVKTCRIQQKHVPNNKCLLKTYLYLLWTYIGLRKYRHAVAVLYHGVVLLFLLCCGRCFGIISKIFYIGKRQNFTLVFIFLVIYLTFFIGISFLDLVTKMSDYSNKRNEL